MKDLRERLAAQGVHTLIAQFADLHGVARGKFVPLAHLDQLLTDGVGFSGASITGTGLPRSGPRNTYRGRGAASTATALPWLPGYARVVCDGFVDGEPFDACPRQVLRRQVARLAARGWHLRTGIEPEFFLLRQEGNRWLAADAAAPLDNPAYDLKSLPQQRGFLQALQHALESCGLDVLQIDHGDAHGQYGLNVNQDAVLASADHLMLFKMAAHALADQDGMVFSMMPKPFADQPGSGLHMQVTLWDGPVHDRHGNARNLFVPHQADGAVDTNRPLSALGCQFVAGVLAHGAALCALAVPTVNGYKRLAFGPGLPGQGWAPTGNVHGLDNRTAAVRTLPSRFEWRLPDASANPYLASAALIAAGLDGIERELALPAAVDVDMLGLGPAERQAREIAPLPRHLDEALAALAGDHVLCAALGDTLTAQFLAIKHHECAQHARHVSDWELARYATKF